MKALLILIVALLPLHNRYIARHFPDWKEVRVEYREDSTRVAGVMHPSDSVKWRTHNGHTFLMVGKETYIIEKTEDK